MGKHKGLPDSIFVKIDLAHFRKVSSTFSPVNALVSKNIKSEITNVHTKHTHTNTHSHTHTHTCTQMYEISTVGA